MRLTNRAITLFLSLSTLLCLNTANAAVQPLTSCAQLQAPRTVLLVTASWCGYCQSFLPIYKEVSDLPEMKNYTFYVKENDDFDPVCNVTVSSVPATFSRNMTNKLSGSTSKSNLIKFVKKA